MAKITLEFNLPEEIQELENALYGLEYKILLSDHLKTLENKIDGKNGKIFAEIREELINDINASDVPRNFLI